MPRVPVPITISKTDQSISIVTSLTGNPKESVHKLTVVLKLEYVVEGSELAYIRIKFRKKKVIFINLTEKGPNIKNYP
jgi:hypothetical protein